MRCRNRRFDSPGWAGLNETTVRDLSGHQRRVTTLEADHLHRAGSACHPVGACRVASSGSDPGDEGGLTKGRLAAFLTALAGSAVLGIVAGLIWGEVAPRALLQEIGRGEAEQVNAETSAFIVADAWFCLIGAVGGLVTGTLGYRFLVRRAGWVAAAGLMVGAVAAAGAERAVAAVETATAGSIALKRK